ncbi:protein TonB [Bradyrhizobium sp. AZCC 1719]|uniref:energy transducer TonB n=1 Tax=Bradyrhizobium sp. AZCC 1719 TaxID=3117028 RepID=UPI002FF198F7
MNAFALHDVSDQVAVRRWGASAFAIVAAHAALVAVAINWTTQRPTPGVSTPAIMVDMAPVSSAPQPTPMDLAPGPVMQQADASPPPEAAQQEVVPEQIAPTPPQEKPEVVAPPEQKAEPTPPKPEPAKVEPEKKPAPVKPKVVRAEAKKPTEAPPAPRTTASPRAERQAPAASAVSSGASAAAIASYNQLVLAHLRRFKQYPPEAKAAGKQGVGRVNFTLSRSGQVMASKLVGSTGHAALDAESLATLRRAQPFPPFPPDMKQASMSFTMPVSFGLR